MILGLLDEAVTSGARLAPACEVIGLDPRTVQRWKNQSVGEDRRAVALRARQPDTVAHVGDVRTRRNVALVQEEGAYGAEQGISVHPGVMERPSLRVVEAHGPGHGCFLVSIGLERGVVVGTPS